jgi:hypothetical protein
MVRKKDGSWRPCSDYRRLNLATTHDRYPLPSILDLSNKLHGCKFFSCIDLVKGYHQIPMAAQDVAKTAIITPFGLFEYLFMPFGLRDATQTFQRFMDSLFKHLPFVFCYLINPAKCVFAAAMEFLGHWVDQHGVRPLQRHVQAISDFPPPQDVKQLQQFLGMVNFYRCFLPGIARTLQPLTDALRGAPKTLEWLPATAFRAAKAALAAAVPLAHPASNVVLSLATDASTCRRCASTAQRGELAAASVLLQEAVDFLAMGAAQRSCPEVAEMMNSTTLQITTQAVGNDSLLRNVSARLCPSNIGRWFSSRYTP